MKEDIQSTHRRAESETERDKELLPDASKESHHTTMLSWVNGTKSYDTAEEEPEMLVNSEASNEQLEKKKGTTKWRLMKMIRMMKMTMTLSKCV